MATDREIAIIIRAKNEAEAVLKKLSAELGTLAKSADKPRGAFDGLFGAIKQGIGIAGGFAVFGKVQDALSGAAGSAIGFEKSMSGIKSVAGATQAEMTNLSALALQLGKDTSFSAGEAAKGIEELIKGGVSIADVFGGAAAASLNLAAAGEIDLASAAEIAANAMNQFGLKGADMAKVSDLIAGAANASSLSVNDFKFSLAAVGSVASLAGQSFDSTAVAIAQLGAAGIKGSDAGTSLKAVLANLIPTTKPATEAMRELGIITADGANQFIDSAGKIKDFGAISEILQTQTAGLTDAQRLLKLELIFGSDGMRAAGILAKEGGEGFSEMAASMGKVTAESVAMERLNNVAGDLEQLKGSAETAGIILLSTLSPALRTAAQAATRFVNDFTGEAQTIITTAQNISGAHGIGMIPAALAAVELRIGETFGADAQGKFHATREAVEKVGAAFQGGVKFLFDHGEEVRGLAKAYIVLTGAQAMGAAPGAIQAIIVALAKLNPLMVGASLLVGGFAIAHEKDLGNTRNSWDAFIGFVASVPGTLKKIFDDTVQDVKQWAAITGHHIRNFGAEWGPLAMSAGKAVVDGFVAGLRQNQPVLAAAWDIGTKAIGAIREAVESRSPSKAAERIGEDVGAGFAIGLESVGAALGAILPTVRDLVAEARDTIAADQEEAHRDHARAVELETLKHGRRLAELEVDLGRAKGKERENVQHRIEEANRAHQQRLEDAEARHKDTLLEQEYDAAAKIAAAQRKQAELRGSALRDFLRDFDDLTRDVEQKAREIGEKAGTAAREAVASAGTAIQEAKSRAVEAIRDLGANQELNRLLRGRRQGFDADLSGDELGRGTRREDEDIKHGRQLDLARQVRRRREEDAKERRALDRDLAAAKTDEERRQVQDRHDLRRDEMRQQRADEDADRGIRESEESAELTRRRTRAAEDRQFREDQARKLQTFNDLLEDEGLKRQIARITQEKDDRITAITNALEEKKRLIGDSETKERGLLAQSYTDRVDDLKTKFLDKVGPLLEEQRAALSTFLDEIVSKTASTVAAISKVSQAAAYAIGGNSNEAQSAIEEAQRIINSVPASFGGAAISAGASTPGQAAAAILNAGTASSSNSPGAVGYIPPSQPAVLEIDGHALGTLAMGYGSQRVAMSQF